MTGNKAPLSQAKKIVIGIPTFRRPQGLARLLASIADQQAPFIPHVLVADNEGKGGAGLKVVEEVRRNNFPFPLTAIPVPERGISQVRNALLKVAFEDLAADALAMVDDDERVEPDWLTCLVAMQQQHGFDVIRGKVLPEFAAPPPRWTRGLDIYHRQDDDAPGGAAPIVYATDNVLLSKRIWELLPEAKFDPAFSLSGGGDAEFFTRLRKHGAKFGYVPWAVSHEMIHASRMTKRWAMQRAYRIGSGDARIFKLHAETTGEQLLFFSKLTGALAATPLLILLMCWSPSRRMRAILLLARQLGKINGLLGYRFPQVYKEIHGK